LSLSLPTPSSPKETKTLLCAPMLDSSGCKIGCILAVNKRGTRGVFTPKDEAWLAVVPEGLGLNPPLLIMKLPLVILPGTFNPF
jgi:hypothetical protein